MGSLNVSLNPFYLYTKLVFFEIPNCVSGGASSPQLGILPFGYTFFTKLSVSRCPWHDVTVVSWEVHNNCTKLVTSRSSRAVAVRCFPCRRYAMHIRMNEPAQMLVRLHMHKQWCGPRYLRRSTDYVTGRTTEETKVTSTWKEIFLSKTSRPSLGYTNFLFST